MVCINVNVIILIIIYKYMHIIYIKLHLNYFLFKLEAFKIQSNNIIQIRITVGIDIINNFII